MLTAEHEAYLRDRGYDDALLTEDRPFSVTKETLHEGLRLDPDGTAIAWEVRSMSRTLVGVQFREFEKKKYRWAQSKRAEHLPNWMGSEWDHQVFYETGCCVIAEGIMDRVAIKRMWPRPVPVFARLSKGVGKQLQIHLARYATRIVTAFDNDEPGQEATQAVAKIFPSSESIQLPAKDPSKFLADYGLAKARVLMKKRIEALNDDLS